MLEMKFRSNINVTEVIEDIVNCGTVDTAAI